MCVCVRRVETATQVGGGGGSLEGVEVKASSFAAFPARSVGADMGWYRVLQGFGNLIRSRILRFRMVSERGFWVSSYHCIIVSSSTATTNAAVSCFQGSFSYLLYNYARLFVVL